MIQFDKAGFSYDERPLIQPLDLSFGWNERVAILGGSGGGKTTILTMMLGLVTPDEGRVLVDGVDLAGEDDDSLLTIRRKFSLVFQDGALFDSLTVGENVAFCLREFTDLSDEVIDEKVRSLLKRVGVEAAMELMPSELSGGMHRRVAIARSLAAFEPKLFLFDEPTTGLDPVNADNICRLIRELCAEGVGLVAVTHKVVDALKMAERFIFLHQGVIHFDGGKREFLASRDPEVQAFLNEFRYRADESSQEVV